MRRLERATSKAFDSTVTAGAELARAAVATHAQAEFGAGTLSNSFRLERHGPDGYAVVSDHPGARLLDEGGEVRAGSKLMPVPLTPAAQDKRPRAFGKPLVSVRTSGGEILLAEKDSKERLVAHYVLKKRVRLSGTGYAMRAAQSSASELPGLFHEAFEAEMSRG